MSNSSFDTWLNEDNRLDWGRRKRIIIRVVEGLAHLHKCNLIIVHLYIKPQNILLDQYFTPKLADFGLAKILDGKCGMCPTILFFIGYVHAHYILLQF
jgi:serine/threonine protein kinase